MRYQLRYFPIVMQKSPVAGVVHNASTRETFAFVLQNYFFFLFLPNISGEISFADNHVYHGFGLRGVVRNEEHAAATLEVVAVGVYRDF